MIRNLINRADFMNNRKRFLQNALVCIIFFAVYFTWFFLLEKYMSPKHVVYSKLDDLIGFNEYFIIPYTAWFFYVAATLLAFMLYAPDDFYATAMFLFPGMIICLIIFTFFPSAQNLRPNVFLRDNIFVDMVKNLYSIDTPTNVCPSIHVLNSVGIHIGIVKSSLFRNNGIIKTVSLILAISICLSTIFLKQHSIVDVFYALILCLVLYYWRTVVCRKHAAVSSSAADSQAA